MLVVVLTFVMLLLQGHDGSDHGPDGGMQVIVLTNSRCRFLGLGLDTVFG